MPVFAFTFRLMAGASLLAVGAASATTLRELPRGAHAGECFSRSAVAPVYRTDRIAVPQPPLIGWRDIPAVYRTQTRQVMVAPGRVDHQTLPAVMGTRMHWVEHPGADRIVEASPVYRWEVRRIQVARAHLVWRAGHARQGYGDEGYGQAISVAPTGEVMCRVRVPARYEIRRIRVLVSPGRTCVVKGPSSRERIVEHFVVTPERVIDHSVAPVYRTVSDRVLVTPGRRVRIETRQPPRFIERRVLSAPAHTRWTPIVCAAPRMERTYALRPGYGAPAPQPGYGQPFTPDYARPRPGQLDGAPSQPAYRAPRPNPGYGAPSTGY